MHADQVDVSQDLVSRLIESQHPQFSGLPLRRLDSTGTVNAILMLGDAHCVRLPLQAWAGQALRNEWQVLPVIARHVSIGVPNVVAVGHPGQGYPLPWAIYDWIPGVAGGVSLPDEVATANTLARFIGELHSIPVTGDVPAAGRAPLAQLDEATVQAIGQCGDLIDGAGALAMWRELCSAEPWDGRPSWIHADLLKPNLIFDGTRLRAVIDFGSAGIGDPAFDFVPAWSVLTRMTRDGFRQALRVSDDAWWRAKAYALHQAVFIIPYYRLSNPAFAELARQTVAEVLAS